MEVFDDDEEEILKLEDEQRLELTASKLATRYGLFIKTWVGQGRIQAIMESKHRKGVCRAIVDHWLLAHLSDDSTTQKQRFREDFAEQKVQHYIDSQAGYDQTVQENNRRVGNLRFIKDKVGTGPTKAEENALNLIYAEIVRQDPNLIPAVPASMSGRMVYSDLTGEKGVGAYKELATALHAAMTKTLPNTPPLPDFAESNQFKRFFRLSLRGKGTREKRAGHAIGIIANFNPYFTKLEKKAEYVKAGSVLRWRVMDPNSAEYARIKDKDFVRFFADLMYETYPTHFIGGEYQLFLATAK